jgi:hypothetical protein
VRIRSARGIGKWPGSVVASQRRVGGGGHLSKGEENGEGNRYFWPLPPFIGGGERGGMGGPLGSETGAGVEPELVASGAHQVPLSRVADMWAAVDILKLAQAGLVNGCTVSNPT